MPRTYIQRQDDGTAKFVGANDKFNKGEAIALGNTDWDAINNPLTAFNFVLQVEGLYFLPIKSVRAFTKENEFEYIREGGVNDYVHLKRKPISKPFTFQIERYVGTERFLDPLALGTELIAPLLLYVYRHKARSGLTDSAPEWFGRLYTFTGCTVMSKEYGELNAERAGLVTEITTISYRELVVVTNPFQSSSEAEEWKPSEKDATGHAYKTKYAATSHVDDSKIYKWETDAKGVARMSMLDSAKTKHKNSPYNMKTSAGKVVSDIEKSKQDADGVFPYEKTVDEYGRPSQIKRTGENDFNRPQYRMKEDKGKIKTGIKQSPMDIGDNFTYEKKTDEYGRPQQISRTGEDAFNRPQYQMKTDKGAIKTGIRQSPQDKGTAFPYTTTTDEYGRPNQITRKSTGKGTDQFNRPQYEMKKNKGEIATGITRSKQDIGTAFPYDKTTDEYGRPSQVKRKSTGEGTDQFNRPQYEMKVNKGEIATGIRQSAYDTGTNFPYETTTDESGRSKMSRTDKESQFNRPQYEMGTDKANVKYAKPSPKDSETIEAREPYSMSTDKATVKHAKPSPKDSEKIEAKQPYSISTDKANVKWAAKPDNYDDMPEAKDPYSIKDGATGKYAKKSSKDSEKPEVKDPYSIKDGASAKYAKKSPRDSEKPEAKDPYSIKDGASEKYAKKSPKDSEKAEAKDPYSIKDGATGKYAKKSSKDSEKPEAKDPYSIKNGASGKYAKKSPKDSEKAQARDPYSIKNGAGAKYAHTSSKDSEKPNQMPQYEMKKDGATNKYATASTKDKPLQTPVTWPPTRRALMADHLKK